MSDRCARLHLRVSPGASHSSVIGRYGEGWKVRISAPPVDGKANLALREFLAGVLGVERAGLRIAAGAGGRDKIIEVSGCDAARADARMATAAGRGA